jgi:hypothetical protein
MTAGQSFSYGTALEWTERKACLTHISSRERAEPCPDSWHPLLAKVTFRTNSDEPAQGARKRAADLKSIMTW